MHRLSFKKTVLPPAVLFFCILSAHGAVSVPVLSRPVMDTARMVSEEIQTRLDGEIRNVYDRTGVQIAVLTVPSIGDETIEDFSMRVARTWKLGQRGVDNGVLLVVAEQEHALRIEVGYGLEGSLTDAACGIIIRKIIAPRFKEGDYSGGIADGVNAVIGIAEKDETVLARISQYESEEDSSSWIFLVVPFVIFALFVTLGITDSMGVGPFGAYWIKAKLTGTPFVRKKRVFSGKQNISGNSVYGDDSRSESQNDCSDDDGYSGGGGDFGGGGASGGW